MTKHAHKDFAPLLPELPGVPAFLVTLDDQDRPVIAWASDDFTELSGLSLCFRSGVYLDDLLSDLGVEEPCSDACPAISEGRWTVRGNDRNGRPCWYEFDIRRAGGLQADTGRIAWVWFVSADTARIEAKMRVAEAFGLDGAEPLVASVRDGSRGADGDADQAYLLDVAHEMRTPLSAVIGALSLLSARHAGDETARRLIEMAKRNSDHLMALTDDLLDVADAEDRAFSIEPEAVNASDLLSDAVRAHAAAAFRKRVFLSIDQLPDDAWVRADRRRLHQVMTNLISNAVKYAPPGSAVTISCTCRNQEVALTIADRGPGIPAAERDKVFGRFFKGQPTDRDRPEGAGLGLAIVRELVERQGGQISLSSRTKEDGIGRPGTEVTVSFSRIGCNSEAI